MKKDSVLLRLTFIIAVFIILLIPLTMIQHLIDERQSYRSDAVAEVARSWANEQLVAGPLLSVTSEEWKTIKEKKQELVQNQFTFLPEDLHIESEVFPELRKRGIYKVSLYKTVIKISGLFDTSKIWEILSTNTQHKITKTTLSFNIGDLRGITGAVVFKWNGDQVELSPGLNNQDIFKSGFSANIPLSEKEKEYTFELELSLNGSENLQFLPLGKFTTVKMKSTWNNPSFIGSFLPTQREVKEDGFMAEWNINHFNRDYPQAWVNKYYDVNESAFGLRLLVPVDEYQKTTRTSKYGIMIVLLTFVSFFMIELYSKIVLHPIQYLLVGLAIIIFYSLLLALSEYLTFNYSYSVTSLVIILLISLYVSSIYKKKKFGVIIALILLFFYGFMFVILQLQDYSLLLGNIALFAILALLMFLTRKVDWYDIFKDNSPRV